MSEFGHDDIDNWLQVSLNKNCSIQDAIYYSLFFECKRDAGKFNRAVAFLVNHLKLKLPDGFQP